MGTDGASAVGPRDPLAPLGDSGWKVALSALVPPYDPSDHKGTGGRVAIVGGSSEYAGAPFFAAMGSLRAGGDLAHVFCAPGAAGALKSYSPEIIVHAYLEEANDENGRAATATGAVEATAAGPGGGAARVATGAVASAGEGAGGGESEAGASGGDAPRSEAFASIAPWLARFDTILVGPGLGRDGRMQGTAAEVVAEARRLGKAIVLDADGLWLLNRRPDLVRGYPRAIVTPNAIELARLAAALGVAREGGDEGGGPTSVVISKTPEEARARAAAVAVALGGPVVLAKGREDVVAVVPPGGGRAPLVSTVTEEGSPRRAGGQGDVLAGVVATLAAHATKAVGCEGGWNPGSSRGPLPASLRLRPRPDDLSSPSTDPISAYFAAAVAASGVARMSANAAFADAGRALGAPAVLAQVGPTVDEVLGEGADKAKL